MKQCPACGNTYTNDQLVFCLEDGATLVNVSESRGDFEPGATLRVDGDATLQLSDEAANQLAPTEASRGRAALTAKRPAPPETIPPRVRQDTHGERTPAPAAPAHNRALVFMLGAIALLLLVIAAVGVALLLRSSSDTEQKTTENRALESNANRDVTANADKPPANANSKPSSNANNANNRNGTTAADAFARAETKVVRGTALGNNDLTGLVNEELRRLRNSVYARHGRMFDAPELQRYFDSRPWYKPRTDYNDRSLTATDRANIKLIQETETRR